jgi:hypothetical protein
MGPEKLIFGISLIKIGGFTLTRDCDLKGIMVAVK